MKQRDEDQARYLGNRENQELTMLWREVALYHKGLERWTTPLTGARASSSIDVDIRCVQDI